MFDNYHRSARLIHVVDGDTIEAEVDLGYRTFHRHKFRLAGLNAPERDQMSTFALQRLLDGAKATVIESKKGDKYGRWLATVWVLKDVDERETWINVNEALLEQGAAVPYDGGAR